MTFDFTGQVVMVTGATGNLGSVTARAFWAAGAHLVLVDRVAGRLAQIFPDLAGSPDHFLAEGTDARDLPAMQQAVTRSLDQFGRLDALVNTVGGFKGGAPLHQTPLDTWDFLINLNAQTVFVACKAAAPAMLSRKAGKIVNVSARAGLAGSAGLGAYSASKSAVIRLTESLAAELKNEGINVNCVLPGTIDTPKNRENNPTADFSRWVSPQAIAEVILFLASGAARAIHGAAIPVYGLS